MTFTRKNETGTIDTSIIPSATPFVTDGEVDGSVFAEVEQYKYQNNNLFKVNESSFTPSYTQVNGIEFVPDYNDEELFEHVYTIPNGDLSDLEYSWSKDIEVSFIEDYATGTTPPYDTRTSTRNISISFRTRLEGVKVNASGWSNLSKYYFSDTYSNSVIIDSTDNLSIGSILNGNTVTNVIKGSRYHYVEFSGSNGFIVGSYDGINVHCGLGIKNKFGVVGWFFTDFKKIKVVPEFRSKLQNEFNKLISDSSVLNINSDEQESLYEGCYSEVGANKLKTIIEDIYQPAKLLNNNLNFSTFENTFISDGNTDTFINVIGSGVRGSNTITLSESIDLPLLFNGEYRLSISEGNLIIININNNILTLSDNLERTFTDKPLTISNNFVLNKVADIPVSSDRLKFYLNDYQPTGNNDELFKNRKNYPSLFDNFSDNTGKFTLQYDWTLLDCKEPTLVDVDDTISSDPDLGNLWDYPSTDSDGRFYIDGNSNEQYLINITPSFSNGYFIGATLSGNYTDINTSNLFGTSPYKTIQYTNDAGEVYNENFYDYKTDFIIPFSFDVGSIVNRITELSNNGNLNNEASCYLIENLLPNSSVIKVDSTARFNNNGWLLIPYYSVEEDIGRKYSLVDWEIIYYRSKTSTEFIVGKRGAFNTTVREFKIFNLSDDELNTIPIVQFTGYGGIND